MAEPQNMHLIFDAKDIGTFQFGRWQRNYNPALCFVSSNSNNQPTHALRQVLQGFPHSQHRPVIVELGLQISVIHSISKPRWNFAKASWMRFSNELDACLRKIMIDGHFCVT